MSRLSRIRRRNRAWLRRHSYSFFSSLGVLLQHKIGTMMTVLVLGIAMFLPLGLYAALANLGGMDLHQDDWNAVTVFFKPGTQQSEVERVAAAVAKMPQVEMVQMISPEQGLSDFRDASGFGSSLDMLDENPLPWVMQITPTAGKTIEVEQNVTGLTEFLQSNSSVEMTQFDFKWLQRLGHVLDLGQTAVMFLMLLFAVAVVVVVANTIRLDVASHSDEIEILALMGAGNAFIRQPFLYSGLWYGLMGGLLAVILLYLAMALLSGPLGLLLETYGTVYTLAGPGWLNDLSIVLGGGLLGWLGAWISVQRYLRLLKVGGRLGRH